MSAYYSVFVISALESGLASRGPIVLSNRHASMLLWAS
jgi:hypothetical protein